MATRTFKELAAIARAVAGSPRLNRALSASDMPEAAVRSLFEDLTKGDFDQSTIGVATSAVSTSSASAANALVAAVIKEALSGDDVMATEASLQAIASLIDGNDELRQSLSDFAVSDDAKATLLRELLVGKTDDAALDIAVTLLYIEHGRRLSRHVFETAKLAAARRDAVIADVRTAVELDEQRRTALVAALQSNLGKTVQPRFTVDPSIIGSVVVRVGDEVFDGSVRLRLEQARKAFA